MNVGERLRKMRTDKKFSIYKLHMLTDISQNHISAIERGKRKPTIETLERLLVPLGITIPELLNESEEVFYLTEDEKTLIMNFRAMTNEKSEMYLKMGSLLIETNPYKER